MWVLEINPNPVEEQPVLLTTRSSLQAWQFKGCITLKPFSLDVRLAMVCLHSFYTFTKYETFSKDYPLNTCTVRRLMGK